MASAVGIAVLDALEEDKCQEVSREVGTYFLEKLADKTSKTPLAGDKMMDVWELTKEAGVLLGKGGYHGNVFRIKPPMCITKEDVDFTVDALEQAVRKIEAEL